MEVIGIPTRDIINALNDSDYNYAKTGNILGRSRERIRVLNNSRSIRKATFAYHDNQNKYDRDKVIKKAEKWLKSL